MANTFPTITARLMTRMRAPSQENLSAREIEVLQWVSKGASNKVIGIALHISMATMKTHLIHICGKLGADDRTAAVTVGLERGILSLKVHVKSTPAGMYQPEPSSVSCSCEVGLSTYDFSAYRGRIRSSRQSARANGWGHENGRYAVIRRPIHAVDADELRQTRRETAAATNGNAGAPPCQMP